MLLLHFLCVCVCVLFVSELAYSSFTSPLTFASFVFGFLVGFCRYRGCCCCCCFCLRSCSREKKVHGLNETFTPKSFYLYFSFTSCARVSMRMMKKCISAVLRISKYHRQNDFFRVPRKLKKKQKKVNFKVRSSSRRKKKIYTR